MWLLLFDCFRGKVKPLDPIVERGGLDGKSVLLHDPHVERGLLPASFSFSPLCHRAERYILRLLLLFSSGTGGFYVK